MVQTAVNKCSYVSCLVETADQRIYRRRHYKPIFVSVATWEVSFY